MTTAIGIASLWLARDGTTPACMDGLHRHKLRPRSERSLRCQASSKHRIMTNTMATVCRSSAFGVAGAHTRGAGVRFMRHQRAFMTLAGARSQQNR